MEKLVDELNKGLIKKIIFLLILLFIYGVLNWFYSLFIVKKYKVETSELKVSIEQNANYNTGPVLQVGGDLNIGPIPPEPRKISEELKRSLLNTRDSSQVKCIYIQDKLSLETQQFAATIYNFLQENKINSYYYPETIAMMIMGEEVTKEGVQIGKPEKNTEECQIIYVLTLLR